MNKHERGTISELLASAYFVEEGYIVSKPITDFNEYDLIVDKQGLKKVQVKSVYWDNSKRRYLISCVTSHIRGNENRYNKKYTENSFDILCGVEKETDSIYLIPITEVAERRSITLYPKEKPKTVNGRFEDFEKYKVK